MTTGDGVDSDLVVPDSFGQCLSYEQQIAYILKLIEEIDGGVIIPEITADATVDQSTGTPSVSVVKTGTDEAPVFTFNFHNIKGETGQRGEKGETGETGATGRPGNDGADGISPTVSTAAIPNGYRITITDADGSHVFDIYNGNDGEIGPAGYSPTVTVQTITGGHSVTITDEDGDHTFNVLDGLDGIDGNDGISPEVSITSITGGHRITIVDVNGSHSFDVMDGADGQPIVPVISAQATVGSGTGTPSVSVSKSGTDEAPTYTFAFDNLKGAAGQNGQDGISPTITVTDHTTYHHIEIVSAGGTESFDVYDGTNGSDGTDGISPTVTVRSITGGHQIEIVSAGGTERFDVMDGTDGATGPAGPGLPTGGTYGQFLMKNGSADYATGWRTLNLTNSTIYKTVAGVTVPTYETNMGGQIIGAYVTLDLIDGGYDLMDPQIPLNSTLIFANGRAMRISGVDTGYRPYRIYLDYSAGWFTYLPKGGTAGQLLAKSTANDGEVEWVNAPSGGNTKGMITLPSTLPFTTGGALSLDYMTYLVPTNSIITVNSGGGYSSLLSVEVVENGLWDNNPTLVIKQAGRISPTLGYNSYQEVVVNDATDGTTTLQKYNCYDLTGYFNDSGSVWDSSLASIRTALRSGTIYNMIFEMDLVPSVSSDGAKQIMMTSIAGTLSYDSTNQRFVITGSGLVGKNDEGNFSMWSTYKY